MLNINIAWIWTWILLKILSILTVSQINHTRVLPKPAIIHTHSHTVWNTLFIIIPAFWAAMWEAETQFFPTFCLDVNRKNGENLGWSVICEKPLTLRLLFCDKKYTLASGYSCCIAVLYFIHESSFFFLSFNYNQYIFNLTMLFHNNCIFFYELWGLLALKKKRKRL